jgi:tetratricopeptide (TPR) repeat protein
MGKPEAAIVFYTRVIAAAPNTPEAAEAYNDRGVAHARLEHPDQAMADYDRAVEGGYPLAWFNRAKARLRLLAEHPDPALKDQVRADLTAFAAYLGQDGPKPPVVEYHREALEAELAEAWETVSGTH